MADVLVDTDVLVDHLRGTRRFRPSASAFYSDITRAELLAGSAADEAGLRRLLAPLGEIPVDRQVAELGARVCREAGLTLPDALIAATAIHHGLSLVTRNRRHFERVRRLRVRGS
jgi:predicted nucleic acid-binding protein